MWPGLSNINLGKTHPLGGTTCPTLLVYYGLTRFMCSSSCQGYYLITMILVNKPLVQYYA